ncbi:hypothetical protein ISN45_Aa01g017720 [Arabidopsis thaliana x Arabidopsis arenosa]|uniref:Uncharacterized protein n=2 Tax=Arabidopsis TaxID=3701 RepID=A0A8T2CIY1_ARASU|nr:hypothetical protein ISN45_Aa01g017720 [Arabidopsis thaliana x Arabidopsis arenosa]KAG7598256.1 hypothetical protein ISN44_As06g025400 [Arabidopsis suecica]
MAVNNSKGKNNFVFKNFSHRISDIDFSNVYRIRDHVKADPSLIKEQEKRAIEEISALVAKIAKKEALQGGEDTSHANGVRA